MFLSIFSRTITVVLLFCCADEQGECCPPYYSFKDITMPLNEPVPDIVLETKQDISLMTESNVDESSLSTLIAQDHPSKFLHSKDKLLPSTVTITMSPSNGQIDLSLAAKEKLMVISNLGGDVNKIAESITDRSKVNRMRHNNRHLTKSVYFKSYTSNKTGRPKSTTESVKKQLSTVKIVKKATPGDHRQSGKDAVEPSTTPWSPKGPNDEAQASSKAKDCNNWKSYVPIASCGGFIGTPPPKCSTISAGEQRNGRNLMPKTR